MIRKIILLTIAVLIVMWFAGAHLIKNKLLLIVEEASSDNIKFSYQDTKISGFPFSWQVNFISPKLTLIEQKSLRDIALPALNIKFNYLLRDVVFDFGTAINCSHIQDTFIHEYKFFSEQSVIVNISFKESIYFLKSDSLWENFVTSVNFDLPFVRVSSDEKDLFNLSEIHLLSTREQEGEVGKTHLKLIGNYNASNSYSRPNTAHLLLDLSYLINNDSLAREEELEFNRRLNFSTAKLRLDNASLDLSGFINLTKISAPYGELDVSLEHYHDFMNILVIENLEHYIDYIKILITKATLADANNVSFKLFFSDKGISVKGHNLSELKIEQQ